MSQNGEMVDLRNEFGNMLRAALKDTPAGTSLGADDDIQYHDSTSILVPKGMTMEHLSEVALRKAQELNKIHSFTHFTNYRPDDGAHAAAVVIKRMFGLTIGQATRTMFGENPPEYRTIDIAYGKKMEVPAGRLEVPALPKAVFVFHATVRDPQVGPVFAVQVESPKLHKARIEEFFAELDLELKHNSIYRGQAVLGAHELKFMNIAPFESNKIVFADDVNATIEASIFGLVEHKEATKRVGLSTKRAVLAYGPYGTGKSSLGLITAKRATAAGWTFLSARAGKDKLKPVLETAALYQPAVVFIEDIDTHTPRQSDKDGISEILDLFDGIGTKDSEICVVMTTNHIEKVPAGMLRPGRLDYCVEINGLDRGGVERLMKAVVPSGLLDPDVDYDAVFAEMADWQPAWVRAAADRAQSFALARTGGQDNYTLTTSDIVGSARSLSGQLDLMNNALEGYTTPELTNVMENTVWNAVQKGLDNAALVDRDDDQVYALRTEKPQGSNWIPTP